MDIRIQVNEAQFARLQKEFKWIPGASEKALAAALNKTIVGVRTDAVRAVRETYIVNAGDVRKTMSIRKASRKRLEAAVKSEGAAISLYKFNVSPKGATNPRPKGGVKVRVKKQGGGRISSGFIASMGSTTGVFQRKGPSRLPIEKLFGPAVPSMLKDAGAFEKIQAQADARLDKNINHEIERILRGY